RRVRLGLVLAEIGEQAGITVSDEEMQRAMFEQVRRFPADRQNEVFEFYRGNANALGALRAPIFEEKVIDQLLTQVSVSDKPVSKEELMAEDDQPEAASDKAETAADKPEKKAKKTKKAEATTGEDGDAAGTED